MALISCPECRGQMSDTAAACPQCGAPSSKLPIPAAASQRMSVGKKVLVGVGIFLILPIFLSLFSHSSQTTTVAPVSGESRDTGSAPEDAAPKAKWEYSDYKDAMGVITHRAELVSDNEIDQESPYSSTHGHLAIRSSPKGGANILFHIENGQVLCHNFMNETLRIKIDGRSIEKIKCSTPSDGDSKYAFIENERHLLSELIGSKKIIIQPTIYNAGDPQFVFSTDGLQWKIR